MKNSNPVSLRIDFFRHCFQELNQSDVRRDIINDPVQFLHRYRSSKDIELVGFICSALAFGQVKTILRSCEAVLTILGPTPHDTLVLEDNDHRIAKDLKPLVHRWAKGNDIACLLMALKEIYLTHGCLENLYAKMMVKNDPVQSLREFCRSLQTAMNRRGQPTRGAKFLVPMFNSSGSYKRLNLFLRWMVRTTYPDMGLWKCLSAADLLIPLDVHVDRFAEQFGWVEKKLTGMKRCLAISSVCQQFRSEDPCSVDFTLAHFGISGRCDHRYNKTLCHTCLFQSVCLHYKG